MRERETRIDERPDVVSPMQRYAAEAVGTFGLVLGGVGAAVLAGSEIGYLGISFAFGLSLLAMIYVIGPISGCHINPAVTFGLWLTAKMDRKHAVGYVVAQLLGATIAAGLVMLLAQGGPEGYVAAEKGLAANGYGEHSPAGYNLVAALGAEIALTFLLVFTVLGATDDRAPTGFAGLAIGLVLTLVHLIGIPLTNTSVNPARSFGPALFVGGWALSQLWVFFLAPLIGGGLAAVVYGFVHQPARPLPARRAEQSLESERRERRHGEPARTPA